MNSRVLGALKGIACGDAVGKQTEGLSRDGVLRWYPDGVHGFEGAPGTVIPRYVGNTKREWRIGETTDDTERTIAVARAIIRDGTVRHASVGRELLTCTKSVHPGVRSLWEFHQRGNATHVAQSHNGCGAAIRVAPVGVLYKSTRLDALVAGAREASIPTHGGPLALAAAAATAAAVSAALDGAAPNDIIEFAQQAAAQAEGDRSGSNESLFAHALSAIYTDLRDGRQLHAAELAISYFPSQPLTIVPLAIAIAATSESADAAILLATNIGGDSDSVASISAAIMGARHPHTVNDGWYQVVESINGHEMVALGEGLSALRY